MKLNEIIFIVSILTIMTLSVVLYLEKRTKFKKNKLPNVKKFESGKISYPHCTDNTDVEKPKKKNKKYYNKKKKTVNSSPVEKRSVGRPKKVQ